MALRVLLADESTTIKKVMQLALQDFAVEVKSVHAGVDVLDVARSFQPDLIFADVLLQKKNGYEVCAAIKNDSELKKIPVVLMWSSFMDLDDAQARACGAEARLEKPFDVETLRKEVLDLVPKTRSQRLAHFLEFSPKLNEELSREKMAAARASEAPASGETPTRAKAPAVPQAKPAMPTDASSRAPRSTWDMGSFADPNFPEPAALESNHHEHQEIDRDDDEKFQSLELTHLADPQSSAESRQKPSVAESADAPESEDLAIDDEAWARQDLSQFKLDLPAISVGDGPDEFKIDMGEDEFTSPDFTLDANDLSINAHDIENAEHEMALPIEPLILQDSSEREMSADRLEQIIRAQSREMIEQLVRKLVPDLAASIIREELERLLEDTEVHESKGTGSNVKDSRL